MKYCKTYLNLVGILILCGFLSCLSKENKVAKSISRDIKNKEGLIIEKEGTFIDNRDGKVYNTVTINGKVWLAQNFAFKPLKGNYWSYNNESNALTHGYLYDWNTAEEIAPDGWRLPTYEEAVLFIKYGLKKTCENVNQLSGKKFRNYKGELMYTGLNERACFWTSTNLKSPYPKTFVFEMNFDKVKDLCFISYEHKKSALSVRYVKE